MCLLADSASRRMPSFGVLLTVSAPQNRELSRRSQGAAPGGATHRRDESARVTDSLEVGSYAPPPAALRGAAHLLTAFEDRFIQRHARPDSVVMRGTLAGRPDWEEQLALASPSLAPGGRILFDLLSRDHKDALAHAGVSAAADDGNTHVCAADVAACCTRNDLALVGIFPYGALASAGLPSWRGSSLATGPSWDRIVTWTARDARFRTFVAGIEDDIVALLPSEIAPRFFVVAERRAAPHENERWSQRNDALRAVLRTGVRRSDLEPLLGSATWSRWRAVLAQVVYPPNLIAAFRLLDAAAKRSYPIELGTLLAAPEVRGLGLLAERKAIDDAMWEFVCATQDDPRMRDLLRLRADFGPSLEYETLTSLAVAVLTAHL